MQRIKHSLCNATTNLLIVYVFELCNSHACNSILELESSFYVVIMGIFGFINNVVSTQTFDHEQLVDSVCMFA